MNDAFYTTVAASGPERPDLEDREGGVKHIHASIKTFFVVALILQVLNILFACIAFYFIGRAWH